MQLALSIALAGIAAYAGICGLLYLIQGWIIYPRWINAFKPPVVVPAGVPSLWIDRGEARIKVWLLHPDRRAALMYFGGNGEDVGVNLSDFDTMLADRAVYLMSYRGYSGSTGSPAEAPLLADAVALYDRVASRHDRIIVMGKSFGSAVATGLAARRRVEKLILVTPFDTLVNVAADHLPWVPVRWLLKDRYESVRWITQVHAPVLVVLAQNDTVVLQPRSEALLAAIAPAYRHAVLIKDVTHDDIHLSAAYRRAVEEFVASAPARW